MAINVSDFVIEAIHGTIEEVFPDASMGLDPPGATENVEINTTAFDELSDPEQLQSGIFGMDAKWTTTEEYRFLLDGSAGFIPENNEDMQIGWFGTTACDDDGVFDGTQYAEYIMDAEFDLEGATVSFDDVGEEWALEFTVQCLDSDGDVVTETTHTANKATNSITLESFGVKTIRVIPTLWNVPNAMPKVSQIFPGVALLFEAEGLYSMDSSDVCSEFSSTLEIPSYSLGADNSDGDYNILNPTGLVQFLREKMKVSLRLSVTQGTTTEKVSIGNYYLYEVPESSNAGTVYFSCKPYVSFLTSYYDVEEDGTWTVAEAVDYIMNKIPEGYEIEDGLGDIVINKYIGDGVKQTDALAEIAIACCGYWELGKNDVYKLVSFDKDKEVSNTILLEDMWAYPTATLNSAVDAVEVNYYTSDIDNYESVEHIITLDDDTENQKTLSSRFLASEERAEIVGNAYLEYANFRTSISVSYRGDMSIEAGDMVSIETEYGFVKTFVQSHTLTYTDAEKLKGSLTGIVID